jgi:hypothetical protein
MSWVEAAQATPVIGLVLGVLAAVWQALTGRFWDD